MNFLDFLNENSYKNNISLEDSAILYLKEYNFLSIDSCIWRGMRDTAPSLILQGNAGTRNYTGNNNNIHNVILNYDIIKNKYNYPLRSKCIIGITNSGKEYTKDFGPERYAIFPINYATIGVCKQSDILFTDTKHGLNISTIANMTLEFIYNNSYIKNKSFIELKTDLEKSLKNKDTSSNLGKQIKDIYGDNIEKSLLEIFGVAQYKFVKPNDKIFHDNRRHEIWVGEKCLAIHESKIREFENIIKEKEAN